MISLHCSITIVTGKPEEGGGGGGWGMGDGCVLRSEE